MMGYVLQQDWMHTPELCALFDVFEQARPACLRFVGGCVRDALRGESIGDIDLAVQMPPEDVFSVLEANGFTVLPMGLAHGVAMICCKGRSIELASLRRDVCSDGRHAQIMYTDDWEEDAARRDFRCNAVYADRDGALFDPVGGIADIEAGRVVFIGDAQARIREDYLRILRFFRFSAWLSEDLDALGLKAIATQLSGLAQLSAERVRAEIWKTLAAPKPVKAVQSMVEHGVWTALFGDIGRQDWRVSVLARMIAAETPMGLAADPLLRLLALVPEDKSDIARQLGPKLKISNADQKRLKAALRSFPTRAVGAATIRSELYWHGPQAWQDRVRLAQARQQEDDEDSAWQALFDAAQDWTRPQFPLSGKDLLQTGIEAGPDMGALLKQLEQEWVASGFAISRDALLTKLATLNTGD